MIGERTQVTADRSCIIVANDIHPGQLNGSLRQGPESAAMSMGFLRLAARRARRFSSPAHVLVCASEGDRQIWQQPFWFTRPANRFIAALGTPTSLTTAAALLSIASEDPSRPIVILPSDFWVAQESVLTQAIEEAFVQLPVIAESVATLGMVDSHPEGQDYLVVGPHHPRKGAAIQARINRPSSGLARQLLSEGAMVASGILFGYAQTFAARIHKYWPHLAHALTQTLNRENSGETERTFSAFAYRQIPRLVMGSARLFPPTFATRAFAVKGCGWCNRRFGAL
jgi:mannose-1-phosphate guanylyltransferase